MYGIALGWSAPTQHKVLHASHKFVMTKDEFSWSVALMAIGAACFCVISGLIRDRFGTKLTILVFGVLQFTGWMLLAYSWRPSMVSIELFMVNF